MDSQEKQTVPRPSVRARQPQGVKLAWLGLQRPALARSWPGLPAGLPQTSRPPAVGQGFFHSCPQLFPCNGLLLRGREALGSNPVSATS